MGGRGKYNKVAKADDSMGKTMSNAKRKQVRKMREAAASLNANGLHTMDAGEALKSVWEASDLQDFLHTAEQNQKDFTAERGVRMVVEGITHVYKDDKMRPLETENDHIKWFELSKRLPIPERPQWDHRMTKEMIDAQERESFLEWRRQLAEIEESEGVLMTPYERNLEVWRQLWRVIERSEVVVLILDARNPLAFRSKATESAVTKAGKRLVLLLNKAELLTEKQRLTWGEYFKEQGITAIFFSAAAAKDKQDEDAGVSAANGRCGDGKERDEGGENKVELDRIILKQEEEEELDAAIAGMDDAESSRLTEASAATGASKPGGKKSRRNNKKLKGRPAMQIGQGPKGPHPFAENRPPPEKKAPAPPAEPTDDEVERTKRVDHINALGGLKAALGYHDSNLARIYTPAELIDFFLLHRKTDTNMQGQPVLAGFIGYPNVGKSSTINVLWQSKKVNVSSTPGKTKHFQTLILPDERRVMLCDCPGLVFPSFATTRDHMIVDGILPISQLKDAIAPMRIVEKRIRKTIFELAYTLDLDWINDKDDSPTTYHLLCNQYARARGYMTDHDKPNMSRAARDILTDYVAGKLVYVTPPPGLKADDLEDEVDEEEFEEYEELEETEEVEEEEEEEEEESSSPGPVNWDHVLPDRVEKKVELTAEEKFNRANANEEAIYAKVLQPKTKKAHRAKHQTDAEVRELNEEGMIVVEVSDDDCIEEIVGPEIPIEEFQEKKMTKKQMRMHEKNLMRGRVGHHHNKGVTQMKQASGYAKIFKE